MIEQEKSNTVSFWCNHIDQYNKDYNTWTARTKKIIKRYRDDRSDAAKTTNKFNILWSNVQTLAPALYDKAPTPNVDRRFQTDDKLGTTSAQILERCVSFYVDNDAFDEIMIQSVQDRLLGGRGTAWVRYEPHFKDVAVEGSEEIKDEGTQVTDDVECEYTEELESEDVVIDYVHWEDFGHTWSKTWQEVRAVWRKVPMSRKELVKRFGEVGNEIQMDASKKEDNTPDDYKRATIYEIWDKDTEKVFWVSKTYKDTLDEREDPLKLSGFFPCPKPIYATLTNDTLVPVPDYVLYQDQAKELDDLTGRIGLLVKALRVAGVYDASAPALSRLLGEDTENVLIPVEQWAVFGEKGGLKGVIDFLPVKDIAEVLIGLYDARDRTKQELYEITGISDVIRGATNPNETLGAQELKGKYAGLRIGAMQKDVARFSRDVVRMFAEIISEHFSLETIKELSGFKLMTTEEKQQFQMMQQQAEQSGQQVPPPPDEIKEMLELPTWEEVAELLKDNTARKFRISIETDSTIKQDQDAEKQARTEFLTAAGGFIQQAAQIPNPELQPLLMEMLKFGTKGFKIGREMETTFDIVAKDMKAKLDNPQPPPEDPSIQAEQAKMQFEGQKLQQDMQLKQAEMQQDANVKSSEFQMKQAEMAQDGQFKQAEIQLKAKELEIKERQLALDEQQLGLDKYEIDVNAETERMRIQSEANRPQTNTGA